MKTKIFFIFLFLIIINGCITWDTPPTPEDYIIINNTNYNQKNLQDIQQECKDYCDFHDSIILVDGIKLWCHCIPPI